LVSLATAAAQHLFLFLHARSLLSSAIRLNTLGPYVSHRLLLHDVRPLVDEALSTCRAMALEDEADERWGAKEEQEEGPATTWPLGEILVARHDALHSKIFNS
jgi:urease accessory protein